ncbi:MAG: hypothetical protein LRY71_01370 [Bacillaceae bacterium]|nr:hypothetical protein [Bacillaceae bacterium]
MGLKRQKLIKARERSKDVPIIFITAISKDISHVTMGYASGAIDYIFKPIDPYILKNKVLSFVQLYKSKREIEQESERLELESNKIKKSFLKLEALIEQRTEDLISANNELTRLNERLEKFF